jgi:hypothetical protein
VCLISEKSQYLSSGFLDPRPVLKTSLNSTWSFKRHVCDLAKKYLSKKALKLTDAEKTQTFENFLKGSIRSDFNETCLGHLGPSLIHSRSWFFLTILFDLRSLQENRVKIFSNVNLFRF